MKKSTATAIDSRKAISTPEMLAKRRNSLPLLLQYCTALVVLRVNLGQEPSIISFDEVCALLSYLNIAKTRSAIILEAYAGRDFCGCCIA